MNINLSFENVVINLDVVSFEKYILAHIKFITICMCSSNYDFKL